MKRNSIIFLLLFFIGGCAFSQKYVFYLHGRIVEVQGANAVDNSNGFGAYKYNDILDSLRRHGFIVLSEVRAKNTDIDAYALKIKKQVDSLLKTGAKPGNITVIGASKGAAIAMQASSYLKNKNVNFVFMAGCYADTGENTALDFYGNILSVYEKSDQARSCKAVKDKSTGITHYKEIEINTGLKHGFLYRPITEWLNPAVHWANGDYK